MREDKIISALIGLVGACGNNPKTENTDRLLIKALASVSDTQDISKTVDEIRKEKNLISPGCAVCKMPCGNTSDYDMSRIYTAEAEIRNAKLHILSEIQEAAKYIYQNKVSLSESEIGFFYKALSYLSYDLEKAALLSLTDEAQDMKLRIQKKINYDKKNYKN